jgi:hypothetical protein
LTLWKKLKGASEKSIEKKYAMEKAMKCYRKTRREKDATEKAVNCYRKIRREKTMLWKNL